MRRCRIASFSKVWSRSLSESRPNPPHRYNYEKEVSFDDTPDPKFDQYPRVTAFDLAKRTEPPVAVKMLVRDYIEDALYNPHYGYFSKQAKIFSSSSSASTDAGFDFSRIKNGRHFEHLIAERYQEYTDKSDATLTVGPGSQVWHTPTELFKPWYGRAIAQCLVSEYLLKYFPYEDFIVYEIGAGNGTLARNILDVLMAEHPEVYERTQYNIIEISSSLAALQRSSLEKLHPCVKVHNKSVFDWNVTEHAPCFLVALEVVDNFAHDAISYDLQTLQPYQTLVTVDETNDFGTLYEPLHDPLIKSYLKLRRKLNHPSPLPFYIRSAKLRPLYHAMPFRPNLSKPEYIPTRLLSMLQVLRRFFPRHKLLLSDFSSLPDTIEGFNAPVVQTRIQGQVVPVTKLCVRQGYFDIFFPSSEKDPLFSRASPLTPTVTSVELGSRFFFSKGRRMPIDGVFSGSGLCAAREHKALEWGKSYVRLLQERSSPLLNCLGLRLSCANIQGPCQ